MLDVALPARGQRPSRRRAAPHHRAAHRRHHATRTCWAEKYGGTIDEVFEQCRSASRGSIVEELRARGSRLMRRPSAVPPVTRPGDVRAVPAREAHARTEPHAHPRGDAASRRGYAPRPALRAGVLHARRSARALRDSSTTSSPSLAWARIQVARGQSAWRRIRAPGGRMSCWPPSPRTAIGTGRRRSASTSAPPSSSRAPALTASCTRSSSHSPATSTAHFAIGETGATPRPVEHSSDS